MAFKRADKKQTFLRMALLGPAGSGKSFTALRIAHSLGNGSVAAFDTERRSLSKYASEPNPDGGVFEFDVDDDMEDFDVRRYISAIQAAEKAGYKVLVIDSLSHAWSGQGGILEFVDARKGNAKGPRVAILGEYDALPEIGHACGHNLIAASAVGAFLAAASVVTTVTVRLLWPGPPPPPPATTRLRSKPPRAPPPR